MALRLQQLQRQAAQLGQLARDLAVAAPQRSEGSDGTGCVQIALGPDGLPAEIRVRVGWRQRLEPERLGAAVLDANNDAVQRAMQMWTAQLETIRWSSRRAELDEVPGPVPAPSAVDLPEPPRGLARDINDLAEQVLSSLQAVQRQPTDAVTPEEGADDGRHVTVQIGPGGLIACEIDPRWAERRGGVAISAALTRALERAIAKRPAPISPGVKIDSLLGDALATLTSLTTTPMP